MCLAGRRGVHEALAGCAAGVRPSRAMRIATWNVNSIRARHERLMTWLAATTPDVVCLQELKCTEADFPFDALAAAGYAAAVHGQKTYNGVAILTRRDTVGEPGDVLKGLSDDVDDTHARLVAASVGGVRVVSAYAPNGQAVGSPAYQYKLAWYGRLRRYLEARHGPREKLVLLGDWNVAPADLDVYDPAAWEGQTLCSEPERAALQELCDWGLVDVLRAQHPAEPKYTWWDYRMLAFPKNRGLRIDHILATPALAKKVTGADVDREARKGQQPSDHAPVWADFDV